jgi:hypothetical protein
LFSTLFVLPVLRHPSLPSPPLCVAGLPLYLMHERNCYYEFFPFLSLPPMPICVAPNAFNITFILFYFILSHLFWQDNVRYS